MNEQRMNAAAFDRWQATYDADVLACDQAGEYPFAGYCQLMEQLFQLVHSREGVSVLELGCGTGLLAGRLERAGHPVTGVDFSEKMLAQARKNAPDSVFYRSTLPQLPPELAGKQFDCIIAAYSLHHLRDEEKYAFFRALRPYLAPEGAILVGDVSFPTRRGLEQCREAYGAEWDADEFYFVREELEQALPEYHLDAIPISFCADVLILTPEEG